MKEGLVFSACIWQSAAWVTPSVHNAAVPVQHRPRSIEPLFAADPTGFAKIDASDSRNMRLKVRNAIWAATDAMANAAAEVRQKGGTSGVGDLTILTQLGKMLMDIDDKYIFPLATPTSSADQPGAAGVGPQKGSDEEIAAALQDIAAAMEAQAETGLDAVEDNLQAATKDGEAVLDIVAQTVADTLDQAAAVTLDEPVAVTPDKPAAVKPAAVNPAAVNPAAVTPNKPAAITNDKPAAVRLDKPTLARASEVAQAIAAFNIHEEAVAASSGVKAPEGTVDLRRSKTVQRVMDDLQKRAVNIYRAEEQSEAAAVSTKAAATAAPPAVGAPAQAAARGAPAQAAASVPAKEGQGSEALRLESKLEALLQGSALSSASMDAARKNEVVATIEALERSGDAPRRPLKEPALYGSWSLVYSNSQDWGRAMLGNKRSRFFRPGGAAPVQEINTVLMKVVNTCRVRIWKTPFSFRVKQEGTYKELDDKTVVLNFEKGSILRLPFLKIFRKGTTNATVTYVSKGWRICRAGTSLLAFRKGSSQQ